MLSHGRGICLVRVEMYHFWRAVGSDRSGECHMRDVDVDHFYIALFSALKQAHWAHV